MKRRWRAERVLPATLVALTLGGAALIHSVPALMDLSQRERSVYGVRPWWQAGFDSLSAACGSGLLIGDLDMQYAPAGRWLLVGLGLAGATMYIWAARQMAVRCSPRHADQMPTTQQILVTFLIAQLAVVVIVAFLGRLLDAPRSAADTAWNTLAVFNGLGWLRGPIAPPMLGVYAALAWIGALGWPIWLFGVHRWRTSGRGWTLVGCALAYTAALFLAAALLTAFERPRSEAAGRGTPAPRETTTFAARYPQQLARTLLVSGAGAKPPEPPNADHPEGSRLIDASLLLVGGLGGAAGGGLKWMVLLAALGAIAGGWWRKPRAPDVGAVPDERLTTPAIVLAALYVIFPITVALGLLVLESIVAGPFIPPATFADAFLDASSAVAGGGLHSPLFETLTDLNLSSGMGRIVDAYQYGMAWLMLAMLIGRCLPVLIFARTARFADRRRNPRLPPLV